MLMPMLLILMLMIPMTDTEADDNNADDTNDIQAAADYGVPSHLLFQPDDLAVQAHVYK